MGVCDPGLVPGDDVVGAVLPCGFILLGVLVRLGVVAVALVVVVVGETVRAFCLRTLSTRVEVVVVVVSVRSGPALKRLVAVVSVCAEARPNASTAAIDKTIFFMVSLF